MSESLDAVDELAGRLVRLRGPRVEDGPAFAAMDRDSEGARRWGQTSLPRSDERQRMWMQEQATKEHQGDTTWLVIETLEGTVVGSTTVDRASQRHGRFGYGIGLGQPYRRNGYGTEAVTLLLRFYFGELRYQKCDTSIYAFNEASLAMHEKLGFTREGRIRQALYTRGEFHDEIVVGITRDEFLERDRHWVALSN
jgi:RimJ/RimL family protein N-acetyltransferase